MLFAEIILGAAGRPPPLRPLHPINRKLALEAPTCHSPFSPSHHSCIYTRIFHHLSPGRFLEDPIPASSPICLNPASSGPKTQASELSPAQIASLFQMDLIGYRVKSKFLHKPCPVLESLHFPWYHLDLELSPHSPLPPTKPHLPFQSS